MSEDNNMKFSTIRYLFKSNVIVFVAISVILSFYMSTIMMMFDPNTTDAMMAYIEVLPEALVRALNFQMVDFSFLGFLSGYYYGFLAMTFPLIFSMMYMYKVLAKSMDDHSITHFLTSGQSRGNHLLHVVVTYVGLLTIMITVLVTLSYVITPAMFEGVVLDARFLMINVYLLIFHLMMGMVMLTASALIPTASVALGTIIGLPLLSMGFDMVARLGEELSWLRFVSFHTLFSADKVVLNQSIAFELTLMTLIGIACLTLTWIRFKRRDIIV